MRTADLAQFIQAREDVRLRRAAELPPPWTNDLAIANYRYCNVRREDDKVTKWIAKNWRAGRGKDPNIVYAMVLARMVNVPETLEDLGYPGGNLWDYGDHAKLVIKLRMSLKKKTWGSAYIISTCGHSMSKEDYLVDHVLAQVAAHPWRFLGGTLAGAYSELTSVDGLGSFLAGQVIADLKNTPGHPLAHAPDWHSWSCHGPGSLRGLNWFFHDNQEGGITVKDYQQSLFRCWQEVKPLLRKELQDLHMQDFQNCLCEFSKYCRIRLGDGRARNKYP